jgi:hypothetical protein
VMSLVKLPIGVNEMTFRLVMRLGYFKIGKATTKNLNLPIGVNV